MFRIILHSFLSFVFVCTLSLSVKGQKQLQKLHSSINTSLYNEENPVLSDDEKTLYFTRVGDPDYIKIIDKSKKSSSQSFRERLRNVLSQIAGKSVDDPENSSFNQDIWLSKKGRERFIKVEHPGYPVNNAYPNSVCAVFPEENSLIVINQFDESGGISKGFSTVKINSDGTFEFPEAIDIFEFNNEGNEVSLTLSGDGEQLFLAMQKPGDPGNMDIYVSVRIKKNLWSRPEPLNNSINTIFRETAPYISRDKKRLYFASDRPGSQGGMDIFVADRLDYTYRSWSTPRLLPVPINSRFDDSAPYLDKAEDYIYFTSKRDGSSDIFRYHLTAPQLLKEELSISIRIIDSESSKPVRGEIYWGPAHDMGFSNFFRTYNGQYTVVLKENELFKFKVIKRGYTGDEVVIDPFEIISDNVNKYQLDLYVYKGELIPLVTELPAPFANQKKITLRNILFEKSEAKVLPESSEEIRKLIKVMKAVPALYISIEGHTDNIGDKGLLQELSEMRAQAIKDFLVQNGINPVRIETLGHGDRMPLNNNVTELERKRNRRVEIIVLQE